MLQKRWAKESVQELSEKKSCLRRQLWWLWFSSTVPNTGSQRHETTEDSPLTSFSPIEGNYIVTTVQKFVVSKMFFCVSRVHLFHKLFSVLFIPSLLKSSLSHDPSEIILLTLKLLNCSVYIAYITYTKCLVWNHLTWLWLALNGDSDGLTFIWKARWCYSLNFSVIPC